MATIRNKWLELNITPSGNDVDIDLCATNAGALSPILQRRSALTASYGGPLDASPTVKATERETWSSLEIHGRRGCFIYHLCFYLNGENQFITASETVETTNSNQPELEGFWADWAFTSSSANREVFSQNLVPGKGDILGQHCLRSPVVCAQSGSHAAALVFDAAHLGLRSGLPGAMNLIQNGSKTILSVGRQDYEVHGHVYYRQRQKSVREFALCIVYDVFASSTAEPGEALRWAGSHLWKNNAGRIARDLRPLPMSYSELSDEIYTSAFATRWRETTVGGKRAGSVLANRAYARDVWFSAWFNQMHSAYGYHHWGVKKNKPEWKERAIAVRDLLLSAPSRKGLFPTIAILPEKNKDPVRWVGSQQQGGGPGILHLMDMSWTVYHLLVFARECVPSPESIEKAREYCNAVLKLQRKDGGLPAYVDEKTHQPVTRVNNRELLRDLENSGGEPYIPHMLKHAWTEDRFVESAEDAASLLALAELAHALPQNDPQRSSFIEGAERIAEWIERWVFPQSRWIDMEVYYSCGPKPLSFYDERSQQWPQNTLSMNFAALGLLRLFELTGNNTHMALARRALDRLQLYQQVWAPPFLSVDGFGGYGVQNTDGEWNDARQAVFASTHLHFHRVTGCAEQLERARAACRASFVTMILPGMNSSYPTGWFRNEFALAAENHGHGGYDENCVVSGYDWGVGNGLACAAHLDRLNVL